MGGRYDENSTSAPRREIESTWDVVPKNFGLPNCCFGLVMQYVLLATTGSFNFGFSLAALNTSKDFICLDFKWCPNTAKTMGMLDCSTYTHYGSFVNVGVFIGATVGCLMGGKLTDFGRRASMLMMHGIFILGAVLSSSAEGFASLLVARIIVGLGVGFSTVCVPMLISEMTPKQHRGFYGVFHQLLITVGIFIAVLLGLAFGETPGADQFVKLTAFQSAWWRIMVGLPIVICIPAVVLFMMLYTTETPHYLIESKQMNTAEALLKQIYSKQDVSEEFTEIRKSIAEARILKNESLSVWSAIRDPTYRNVIIIGCVLSVLQQFTGINVLMANSKKLYEASGLRDQATALSVGMTALNVLMTFPPIFFVERLGRRTLMLIGTLGQALCLAPAMIANLVDYTLDASHYISVAATFGYVVFFAVAYGPILWVYLHEIFPAEIKQGAAGLASAINWLATIAMVLPSEYLLSDNPTVIFCIFTVMGVIAFVVVFFFMKETKGLSIDDSPYFRNKARRIPKSFSRQNIECMRSPSIANRTELEKGANNNAAWDGNKLGVNLHERKDTAEVEGVGGGTHLAVV